MRFLVVALLCVVAVHAVNIERAQSTVQDRVCNAAKPGTADREACIACAEQNKDIGVFTQNCYWWKAEKKCATSFFSFGDNYVKSPAMCDGIGDDFPVEGRLTELKAALTDFTPVDLLLMDKATASGLFALFVDKFDAVATPTPTTPTPSTPPKTGTPDPSVPTAPTVKPGDLGITVQGATGPDVRNLAKGIYDRSCAKVTKILSTSTELLGWNAWSGARDAKNALKRTIALDGCNLFTSIAGAVPVLGDVVAGPAAIVCSGLTLLNDLKNFKDAKSGFDDISDLMFVMKGVLKNARGLSSHCTTFQMLFSDKPREFLKKARPRVLQAGAADKVKEAVHASFCAVVDSLKTKGLVLPSGAPKDCVGTKNDRTIYELEVLQLVQREKACSGAVQATYHDTLNSYIALITDPASTPTSLDTSGQAVYRAYNACYEPTPTPSTTPPSTPPSTPPTTGKTTPSTPPATAPKKP